MRPGLRVSEKERRREQGSDSGFGDRSVFCWEEDDGVESAELVDGLAAGSTGLAGGFVEVGDGNGTDADAGAVEADGGSDSDLLGTDGESVGGVFDVAASDDGAVGEQDSRADAKIAVGCIGVMGDCDGALLQVCGKGRVEPGGVVG
jgi:hypothetical protein